jgi:hypothetical protein
MFLEPEDGAERPWKKMPSTAANAIVRSVKLVVVVFHHLRADKSQYKGGLSTLNQLQARIPFTFGNLILVPPQQPAKWDFLCLDYMCKTALTPVMDGLTVPVVQTIH